MLAVSAARKPAPMLALRGAMARTRVRPTAFGNALGSSIVDEMSRTGEPLPVSGNDGPADVDPEEYFNFIRSLANKGSGGGMSPTGSYGDDFEARDAKWYPDEENGPLMHDARMMGKPEVKAILDNLDKFLKFNRQSAGLNPEGAAVADIIKDHMGVDGLPNKGSDVAMRGLLVLSQAAMANVSKSFSDSVSLTISSTQTPEVYTEYMLAKDFLNGLSKDLGTFQEGGRTYQYFGTRGDDWRNDNLLRENLNVPAYRKFYDTFIDQPSTLGERLKGNWPQLGAMVVTAAIGGVRASNASKLPSSSIDIGELRAGMRLLTPEETRTVWGAGPSTTGGPLNAATLTADQAAALNRLGVSPEAHGSFASGEVTSFQYPTAGGHDVYGFLQYKDGALTSQLFSINNTAGGAPAAFRTFVSGSNDLAAALGLKSLELQGGSVINPDLANALASRGFTPKTVPVPEALGGGTQEVLSRTVPVKRQQGG